MGLTSMFALLLVLVARASASAAAARGATAASRGATAFPRTCLVISGYDVEATIGEAIESVGAQSESDNVFLIFVDDGSTDGTACAAEAALEASGLDHSVVRIPMAGRGGGHDLAQPPGSSSTVVVCQFKFSGKTNRGLSLDR